MKKLIILTAIFWVVQQPLFAQNIPPLERLVSIDIKSQSIDVVLKTIAEKTKVNFSYSPTSIDVTQTVSVKAINQPVREVLIQLLGSNIELKTKNQYIILQKKTDSPSREFYVMGYVFDKQTGSRLEQASIYEPLTLASAVSNEFGYYKIKLRTDAPNLNLLVKKETYKKEKVSIDFRKNKSMNISLLPLLQSPILSSVEPIQSISIKFDTLPAKVLDSTRIVFEKPVIEQASPKEIDQKIDKAKDKLLDTKDKLIEQKDVFLDWLLTQKQQIHFRNIEDTFHRTFQVSLLPLIGTNHVLSPKVINDFSFNIIAGYSLGVNKLELGGFANLVRQNMNGIQAAGFANLVGQNVNGIQMAGFSNLVGNTTNGIQLAGFGNLNLKNINGIQMAGFGNLVLKNVSGIEMAGFGNVVVGNSKGIQMAGFLNFVGGEKKGMQISVVNIAKKVNNGLQIGLVNVAYESNSIPIGLVSYIQKNGYRRLELATSEINYLDVSLKTGVPRFYNIFTAGYNFKSVINSFVSIGYGIGTSQKLGKRFGLNLDATSSYLLPVNAGNIDNWTLYVNQLNRLSLGIEYKISKRFAVFVAPNINYLYTANNLIDFASIEKLKVSSKRMFYYGEPVMRYSWFGYQVGIRICNRG